MPAVPWASSIRDCLNQTGPLGNTVSGSLTQSVWGIGDTVVAALLGWQEGNSHWNLVATGTFPTGVYDPNMIAFLGLHRPSLDVKGAYTYLNPQTGLEISGAVGITFNSINSATNYQTEMSSTSNGISMSILHQVGPPGSADTYMIR